MAMDLATQKKRILPFLDRAQEVETIQPKIAYYCRLYALEKAVGMGQDTLDPKIRDLLLVLANKLAATKPQLGINEAADQPECEKWASMVFAKADKNDRAGHYAIARKSFFYSTQFFEVAARFGPLSGESQRLRKYALWRSKTIDEALKSGTVPEPPSSLSVEERSLDDEANDELMSMLASLPAVPLDTSPATLVNHELEENDGPEEASVSAAAKDRSEVIGGMRDHAQPMRRFVPHQEVIYCADGAATSAKQKGIIGEVIKGPDGAPLYRVALQSNREVVVPGELLAPHIKSGATFVYSSEQGPEQVMIEEIYASQWPPTYLVKRRGGSTILVEDENLAEAHFERQETRGAPVGAATTDSFDASRSAASKREDVSMNKMIKEFDVLSRITEERSVDLKSQSSLMQEDAAEDVALASIQYSAEPTRVEDARIPNFDENEMTEYTMMREEASAPSVDVVETSIDLDRMPRNDVGLTTYNLPGQVSAHAVPVQSPVSTFAPSLKSVVEAEKMAKSAASALSFEDVPTAVKLLTESLRLLTQP